MPVFPPIAASTIPATVVGMAIQSMPRNQDAAAKPAKSVIVPPPIPTTASDRVNPAAPSQFHKDCRDCDVFAPSPSATSK